MQLSVPNKMTTKHKKRTTTKPALFSKSIRAASSRNICCCNEKGVFNKSFAGEHVNPGSLNSGILEHPTFREVQACLNNNTFLNPSKIKYYLKQVPTTKLFRQPNHR